MNIIRQMQTLNKEKSYGSDLPVKLDINETQINIAYTNSFVALKKEYSLIDFNKDILSVYKDQNSLLTESGNYIINRDALDKTNDHSPDLDQVMTDKRERKSVVLSRVLLIKLLQTMESDRLEFQFAVEEKEGENLAPVFLEGRLYKESGAIMPIKER